MDAIFDSFLSFDLGVFEWIQSIQSPILTTIMVIITTLGDEGIIFIAAGLVLFFTKKYRKIGLAMLISLVVMLVFTLILSSVSCINSNSNGVRGRWQIKSAMTSF